jgi:PAS domain S-box-containing protein
MPSADGQIVTVDFHGLQLRSPLSRYSFAVLAVGAAVALTVASGHLGLAEPPVAAFLAAILLTGWYAGAGPVVLATLLSVLVFDFFFVPPLYRIDLTRERNPRLVWFLMFAILAAGFSAGRRRAGELLKRARDELEERVAARTAELRRSEAYLLAAQRLSHTGCWAWRIGNEEIYWSTEYFRIVGLDPETATPNRELGTRLWHPDDREFAETTIETALREKRGYEMDVRIVRPDGSIRYVHSFGQPVFDQAGEVVELIGVLVDVTERKRAERALRRARERALKARFTARLDERNRLARELHDTLLQGFTGVALKLVAIINQADGAPGVVAQLRDLVDLAQGTLTDARRSVWDLRSGPPVEDNLPTALRSAAENALRTTELALEFRTEGVQATIDPEVEAVLLRVMQEALANIVKHAAARTVRLTLGYETRRVRLRIVDDGRGFVVDPDLQSYGGHWGLLGMRERATQLRGTLSIRSTPGAGTEIVLLVPYSSGRKADRIGSPGPNRGSGVANRT